MAETPTTRPVYEAANNPLTEVSAMVFYRGLEHLIKDFYLACLILNRSLNCRASKCQCSLNIYIPSLRRKTAEMANKGKAQAAIPSCFKGKGLEMMGGRSPSLISEAGREMWHLRALWRLVLRLAEKPHPANNTPPSPNIS